MPNYGNRSSTRKSDDTMDDDTDDKDDTKRKSRNLSEKKRRDQFNLLINELSSMVSTNSRKMDKSTVLKSTIAFLKNHNGVQSDLQTMTIYDIVYEGDRSELYNLLLNPGSDVRLQDMKQENPVSFVCHCKRGGLDQKEELTYEAVLFVGQFRSDLDGVQVDKSSNNHYGYPGGGDSRAPPIIGYLPFEVLGTSGYDYYHVDDLDKVVNCHEALMQKGEGTSCYYRFLTKGQQWIWLQTRFFITYHQWNSKPEFIVCTHRVVSYVNLLKQEKDDYDEVLDDSDRANKTPSRTSPWSSKSSDGTLPDWLVLLFFELGKWRGVSLGFNVDRSGFQKTSEVREIPSCCGETYIGQTGRLISTRMQEHINATKTNDMKSAVAEHSMETGHLIYFEKTRLLGFYPEIKKYDCEED
ncbi:hypothetical protein AAG570_004273 [Ranatra chinensis]|uniref:Clock n=1 Tax=Ranatra chinensis TaxID=642074 RepID=A0ABD0YNY3_9HEMI